MHQFHVMHPQYPSPHARVFVPMQCVQTLNPGCVSMQQRHRLYPIPPLPPTLQQLPSAWSPRACATVPDEALSPPMQAFPCPEDTRAPLILPMAARLDTLVPREVPSAKSLLRLSLEALLPVAAAFLCTYSAKHDDCEGILVSNFSRLFNETFGACHQTEMSQHSEPPFIFKEDTNAIVDMLVNAGDAQTHKTPDGLLRVLAPPKFLALQKRRGNLEEDGGDDGVDLCGYETSVPARLVGYIIGRNGEKLKEIFRRTGVSIAIQRQPASGMGSSMHTVRMFFGRLPVTEDRHKAAMRALDALRELLARLYDSFSFDKFAYVYMPFSETAATETGGNMHPLLPPGLWSEAE